MITIVLKLSNEDVNCFIDMLNMRFYGRVCGGNLGHRLVAIVTGKLAVLLHKMVIF